MDLNFISLHGQLAWFWEMNLTDYVFGIIVSLCDAKDYQIQYSKNIYHFKSEKKFPRQRDKDELC